MGSRKCVKNWFNPPHERYVQHGCRSINNHFILGELAVIGTYAHHDSTVLHMYHHSDLLSTFSSRILGIPKVIHCSVRPTIIIHLPNVDMYLWLSIISLTYQLDWSSSSPFFCHSFAPFYSLFLVAITPSILCSSSRKHS